MSFSDREKHLVRAAFSWGQIAQKEGYTLSDTEIDKSMLFRRLLAGRPPLAFPPPLRHGFPWYEVIEGRSEHVVSASEASAECSMIAPGSKLGDTCILIDGAFWRVAETLCKREEYIVEWGDYPMQWRLKKSWDVNYEMTQQLHIFRQDHPHAPVDFDHRREYSEFRIGSDQTVWLSEWHLSRIGLPGWVWMGSLIPLANKTQNLTVLCRDLQGPLIIAEAGKKHGAGWLRIEQAGNEFRFLKLGEQLELQQLIATAAAEFDRLLHSLHGEDLEVMDWRNGEILRNYRIPKQLAPLEQFDRSVADYNLMPENAYAG